jgi:hypothetical protein
MEVLYAATSIRAAQLVPLKTRLKFFAALPVITQFLPTTKVTMTKAMFAALIPVEIMQIAPQIARTLHHRR